MTRSRYVTAAAASVAVVGLAMPATAQAAPDGSLKGLVLSGSCGTSSELKNVVVAPRAPVWWIPVPILDSQSTPTGKWLFPYQITATGPGLKTRHLGPGETLTRPGPAPRKTVTSCVLDGATKEDGPFTVTITGVIRPD